MKKVVQKEGKNVLLDTGNDERLYAGHQNTGPRQNRWIDFHAHRLKSEGELAEGADPRPENYVFYLAHYSQWQGENSYIQELTLDEAKVFAAENYDELDCDMGLLDESEFE